LWQWINGGESPREAYQEAKKHVTPAAPAHEEASTTAPLPKVKRRHERGGGDIVLIIDDLGFDGQPLDRLMALDPNLNCSILPNGTRAAEFAKKLNARGFEILCHLPMEPKGHETPGRGAILTSMSDEEITRTTRENIEAIPHARGVNNHMGSRATSDRRVMTSVLRAIPENMYFIDSRTAGGSVAAEVAREMKVPTATRNVFLDDVATERGVREQLDQLAASAQKHGVAVGIGHPYAVTVRVLTEELPALRARGFRLVRASAVVR
jgi:polysaccharide deacetylase 2 family uncharacterized protein YibQ